MICVGSSPDSTTQQRAVVVLRAPGHVRQQQEESKIVPWPCARSPMPHNDVCMRAHCAGDPRFFLGAPTGGVTDFYPLAADCFGFCTFSGCNRCRPIVRQPALQSHHALRRKHSQSGRVERLYPLPGPPASVVWASSACDDMIVWPDSNGSGSSPDRK